MPLRVTAPSSPLVAVWRAPWWQRIVFPAVGAAIAVGSLWPYAGEPYEPMWLGPLLGVAFVTYPLRPKLALHEDSLYIRGFVLSRVIPIEEISAIEGGYGGLDIWWGDGQMSEATAIGEQTNLSIMPGSDGRRHTMKALILETRDAYLRRHRLTPLPDPRVEDERLRREFQERGWVEDPPAPREKRKYRQVT